MMRQSGRSPHDLSNAERIDHVVLTNKSMAANGLMSQIADVLRHNIYVFLIMYAIYIISLLHMAWNNLYMLIAASAGAVVMWVRFETTNMEWAALRVRRDDHTPNGMFMKSQPTLYFINRYQYYHNPCSDNWAPKLSHATTNGRINMYAAHLTYYSLIFTPFILLAVWSKTAYAVMIGYELMELDLVVSYPAYHSPCHNICKWFTNGVDPQIWYDKFWWVDYMNGLLLIMLAVVSVAL